MRIGAGAKLHLVVSAFRSIEARRPQVRATTTGISAVVSPTGEVVASAGVHERTALVASVAPLARVTTLAVRWGDWASPLALLLALAVFLGGGRGRLAQNSTTASGLSTRRTVSMKRI